MVNFNGKCEDNGLDFLMKILENFLKCFRNMETSGLLNVGLVILIKKSIKWRCRVFVSILGFFCAQKAIENFRKMETPGTF
jgi:hypothetical protein